MHENSGTCLECAKILNRYPNLNEELRVWVVAVQIENPDFHVSCAGRNHIDQEVAFERGASRAHFGQSAHNYNCAVDIFQLKDGQAMWSKAWFDTVVAANIYPNLNWYGSPGASFYELPHVEIRNWRDLVQQGLAQLVE